MAAKQSFSSTNVMRPEEYASQAALTDGLTTIDITPRPEAKAAGDTIFIPAKVVIPSAGITKDNNGFFLVKNVKIRGTADPEDKDDVRNKYDRTREMLQTSVNGCPGFGALLELLEPKYTAEIEKLQAAGVIKPLLNDKKLGVVQKPIIGFLHNKVFSDNHKTKAGQVNPDPIIRFTMDFGKFHEKNPIKQLRGTPVTQFFDARTKRIESKVVAGKTVKTVVYDLAQVEVDGKMVPVDRKNMHLFITEGSTLVEGRVLLDSAADSKGQVSIPLKICRAVILPGEASGDMDDTIADEDETVTAPPVLKTQNAVADAVAAAIAASAASAASAVTADTTSAADNNTNVDTTAVMEPLDGNSADGGDDDDLDI